MMKAISYSCLVCLTVIVWCKCFQATDEDSFAHGPNMTNNVQCILVNKRNESHYSASLGMNETSKPCVVTFSDSDISAIFELAKVKITNIVDIDIKFQSNTSNKQWVWTNRLGLEILSLLNSGIPENFATKSLSVGRKAAQLAVSENPRDCVLKENSSDFLAVELFNRLQSFSGGDSELCYKTQTDTWYRRCCKMKFINCHKNGHQCYLRSAESQFSRAFVTLFLVTRFFIWFGGNLFLYMFVYLPWKSEYSNKWYHTLNESPMSLSSVLSALFWDGYGLFKSSVRRIFLAILGGYLFFLFPSKSLDLPLSNIYLPAFAGWVAALFFELFLFLSVDFKTHKTNRYQKFDFLNCLFFDLQAILYSATLHSRGTIFLLTLPFNIKHWRERLQRLHDWTISFFLSRGYSNTFILKGSYFLMCFFYIPVTFVFCIVLFFIFFILLAIVAIEGSCLNLGFNTVRYASRVMSVVLFFLSVLVFYILLFDIHMMLILSIFGIILNIVYFFPYITFVSVLSFYTWNFWKSVEEKYFILKALIYEEIEDSKNNNNNSSNSNTSNNNNNTGNNYNSNTSNNNNNSSDSNNNNYSNTSNNNNSNTSNSNNNNSSDSNNDNNNNSSSNSNNNSDNNDDGNNDNNNNFDDDYEIVCVVSKELYNKIRERLLPYDKNLFYFALKLFFIVGFCYIALYIVKAFQASDVPPAIQMFTSLSFGAVPYLLNIAVSRKGDEEKAAWKKQLRVRVKQLVIKFTTKNPEYLQILLKKNPNENENLNESDVPEEEERLINNEAEGSCNNSSQIVQIETSV